MKGYIFESDRLGFRLWKELDKEAFAKMNSNEEVVRYFPKPLEYKESDELFRRIQEHFKTNGYDLWLVEIKDTKEFIGISI